MKSSFLGTSGQNISDIYKFVSGEDRLKMAKKTLKWGHLAPTAPDTICECSFFLDHFILFSNKKKHQYSYLKQNFSKISKTYLHQHIHRVLSI